MSDDNTEFPETTYTPTDLELIYLREALGPFFADQWLTDILFKVKGGKEATVYCCRAHPSTGPALIAAKVYRPRMFRAMRNDAFYRIGRTLIDPVTGKSDFRGRASRARKKRSAFGKQVESYSWNRHEYDLLARLHAAGAAVPQPLAHGQNCILMQFLGDANGGAPTLHSVALDPSDVRSTYDRLMADVERMLALYVVHADLSPHNVLWHDGRAWVIDFPQAVTADAHPEAFSLLRRDIDRLSRYFQKLGVACDAPQIAHDLWSRLLKQEL